MHSDYVIPSMFWVEEEVEKTLLIDMYKENTKKMICKYYKVDRSVINGGSCVRVMNYCPADRQNGRGVPIWEQVFLQAPAA